MTRKRHTEEQIIAVLKDAHAGIGVHELCRKHGISDATFYKWRTKYAGLNDVKKLRQLEDENRRLKQMVAEQALDIQALKAINAKTGRAQGEASGGSVEHRALWAQSATGVPASRSGSPDPALSRSASGGSGAADSDPGACRAQAAIWLSAYLCVLTARGLAREP